MGGILGCQGVLAHGPTHGIVTKCRIAGNWNKMSLDEVAEMRPVITRLFWAHLLLCHCGH